VRFDASSIAGASVQQATLTLYVRSLGSPGDVRLRAITSGWNEGGVTWQNQPPAEAAAAGMLSLSAAGVAVSVDVTGTVQRWADGTLADAGFLVETAQGIKALFDSKEADGGTSATLEVVTGDGPVSGRATVLDFTDPDACTIDEPGIYVLDRSWQLDAGGVCLADSGPGGDIRILVSASDVVFDLKGFSLVDDEFLYGSVIRVTGSDVVIRNGRVFGGDIQELQGQPVSASGARVIVDHLTAGRIALTGDDSIIRNSTVVRGPGRGGEGVVLGTNGVLENSYVTCGLFPACVEDTGARDGLIVRFNQIGPGAEPAVQIQGNDAVIEGNVLLWSADGSTGIDIDGNNNAVVRNTVRRSDAGGTAAISIDGSGNVVDGNLVEPGGYVTGIEFLSGGNFFGDNRVSAAAPFSGTGTQTDWGGNIAY